MALANERNLLLRAKRGDGAAFGEMARYYQTAVFNVAYRMLGRRQDAEDAAQEAFLRAYRALATFDVDRPFAPWIKRIVANVCLNRLQSARVKPQVLAADMGNEEEEPADMDRWAHNTPTPEQSLLTKERAGQIEARVRAAILGLPPRYRAVIELRHFQEMRYAEIAEALQQPLSAIKSDLFRARKMLAQRLKEIGD